MSFNSTSPLDERERERKRERELSLDYRTIVACWSERNLAGERCQRNRTGINARKATQPTHKNRSSKRRMTCHGDDDE